MKKIISSGPVIVEDGKLLVIKDSKDDFYKIPGGQVEKQDEDLEEICKREFKEETNGQIEILEKLSTMYLNKRPNYEEKIKIELHHYRSKLLNKNELSPLDIVQEIKWLGVEEIKKGKYDVSPNIGFLIEKGDIK